MNTGTLAVVLAAHGLPARWRGRDSCTVLALGWGDGQQFLATWQAWRDDPGRCAQLHYVAIDARLPSAEQLALDLGDAGADPAAPAHALLAAWPPATTNLHPLDFDAGRVHLLLGRGAPSRLLPLLRLAADVIVVAGELGDLGDSGADEIAAGRARLKGLARCAAPSATLTIEIAQTANGAKSAKSTNDADATRHAGLQRALRSAGFDIDTAAVDAGQPRLIRARYAPRPAQQRHRPAAVPPPRTAMVVGAGIAGAAAAQALARLGLAVTVFDRHPEPAAATSGNPAGLFHGTVNPDDGRYARLFRAAALLAQREYRAAIAQQAGIGSVAGLLRLNAPADDPLLLATMQAQLQQLGLPADYVQALDAAAASALAGVPLAAPAWFYPGGGWMSPPVWVRLALATPGIHFRGGISIDSLASHNGQWQLRAADGTLLAAAPLLVLAAASDSVRLLATLQPSSAATPPWPLQLSSGQVTHWQAPPGSLSSALALPVAGDGFVLPLPSSGGLLCGATSHALSWPAADEDAAAQQAAVCAADHQHNLMRLQRLTGLQPPPGAALEGRSGWRLHSADRLPITGPVPLLSGPTPNAGPGQRARDVPRHPGLYVLTALGSRGLTLAPLLARLVAAQATGTPWPLERDLVEAVDPARWALRQSRRAAGATACAGTGGSALAGDAGAADALPRAQEAG